MHISYESLVKDHKDKAPALWREICKAGGFGELDPCHDGGLDVSDDSPAKAEIEKLLKVKGDK